MLLSYKKLKTLAILKIIVANCKYQCNIIKIAESVLTK